MSTAGNSSVCDQACDVLLERLPDLKRLILTEGLEKGSLKGCGTYADVYDGTLSTSQTEKKIAIKCIRVIMHKETDAFVKAFEQEVNIWSQLDHVNVISFLGITMVDNCPALVSEWMDNGTMREYLCKIPLVNKLEMLQGVAAGLSYLHRSGIVHADLKGDNILMSADGKPKIADFGISQVVINSMTIAGSTEVKGSARWMAPELLLFDPGDSASGYPAHTKATDVWAFGMVVYEVLSGKIPYFVIRNEMQVMIAVVNGKLPEQPFSDEQGDECSRYLWSCCLQCWRKTPRTRPKSYELDKSLLSNIAMQSVPSQQTPGTLHGQPNPAPSAGTPPSSVRSDLRNLLAMLTAGTSSVRDLPYDVLLKRIPDLKRFILIEGVEKGTMKGFGSYASVYDGTLSVSQTKKKIAIKCFRVILYKETDAFMKIFEREVNIWSQANHVNVVSFLGITVVDNGPALVSEWMDNGTITEYLSKNPSVNKLEIVQGVAAGLSYLHRSGIVHAGLKGDNILVSADGKPKIKDFGISRMMINGKTIADTTGFKGDLRWMAPELLRVDLGNSASEDSLHTKATDVWAFGMVVYEVLSGKIPYYVFRSDAHVLVAIYHGKLPEQPFSDEEGDECSRYLWSCCLQCWKEAPRTRPKSYELELNLLRKSYDMLYDD